MCEYCDEKAIQAASKRDNPIFSQLVEEYRRAGRRLPWVLSYEPTGTVGILNSTPQGAMPKYRRNYGRQIDWKAIFGDTN